MKNYIYSVLLFILLSVSAINIIMASSHKTNTVLDVLGAWEAQINVNGSKLQLLMNIKKNSSNKLIGTIDSPNQSAFGLKMSNIKFDGSSLSYHVRKIGASYKGEFNTKISTIDGFWKQGGGKITVNWMRQTNQGDNPQSLRRSQTPVAPFPYDSIEYSFKSNDILLLGTLTLPSNKTQSPAVVLISGSGPQDRDSEIFNHSIFWVLSDILTRHGFAVLRYDDRGVGKSQGQYNNATTYDFAEDAISAVKAISLHPLIDENRIAYLGLSEGAIIAAIAQNRGAKASKIVMLSPPMLPYSDLVVDQAYDITLSTGADEETAKRVANDQREIINVALSAIKNNKSMRNAVEKKLLQMGISPEISASKAQPFDSAWLKNYIQLDPYDEIKNVDVPILAIWGDKDVQVNANKNYKKIKPLVLKQNIETIVFPKLNHLLQPSDTGAISEYADINITISDKVISKIVEWMQINHD